MANLSHWRVRSRPTPVWALPGRLALERRRAMWAAARPATVASMRPWSRLTLRVDPADPVERLEGAGLWEPHVQKTMDALIVPGQHVLDVGAHVGFLSALAAECVGPAGRVTAFEADPATASRARAHLQPYAWARVVTAAVWHQAGELEFAVHRTRGQSGWGKAAAFEAPGAERIRVPTVALDAWAAGSGAPAPSLIKMDAEGAEPAVVAGMPDILRSARPYVIAEVNVELLARSGASRDSLTTSFRQAGYLPLGLRWQRWRGAVLAVPGQCDEVLFVPDERWRTARHALVAVGFVDHAGLP